MTDRWFACLVLKLLIRILERSRFHEPLSSKDTTILAEAERYIHEYDPFKERRI